MSSRRLDLTDDAEHDISEILRASLSRWGAEQRDRYRTQLDAALGRLLLFPESGKRADAFQVGLRTYQCGQHVIYYQITDQAIIVVRLLHVRMDAATQFVHETF